MEKENNLKKREQNFSLIKFILGTVFLGFIGQWINLDIQQSKIDLDIRKEETKGLQGFLDRYTSIEIPEKKLDFLKFMSTISQSPEVRERYDNLHSYVEEQIVLKDKTNDEIDNLGENMIDEAKLMNTYEKVIVSGEPEEDITVEQAEAKLNELLKKDEIKQAVDLTNNIRKAENKITPFIPTDNKINESIANKIILSEPDAWLKEGFFRNYEGYTLVVNDLSARKNIVSFEFKKTGESNKNNIESFELQIGNQEIIKTNEMTFYINLKNIGRAGKNPFNKAAIYDIKIIRNN
ncbi:hypothetical protein [Psychroserpens sp.]|uniref:hypothetical protein n=1 Tax=Psychroserpens sp. TaxID=2020870 RepID=UPI001B13DCFC|nr:hypothetical protein [Psychroserpens sp.]MBO6606248.1 hypothetical protein [Psychroserpens sp.]MBO6630944.1 hypothetical protein [Psychroserpens sp.]MBO6652380.1 hypothetical protein [Psychroserpens sp.]MBO6681848.1 hypothetical protein [Psychroserpens sp.]MBO6749623.1 hypothetical protein [Psychroserpens sp.]